MADRIQQHADRGDQKVAYTRTSEIRSAGFSGWRWGDRELMVTDSFFVAKKWHLLKPYTVSGKPIRRCDEEEGLGMWYSDAPWLTPAHSHKLPVSLWAPLHSVQSS